MKLGDACETSGRAARWSIPSLHELLQDIRETVGSLVKLPCTLARSWLGRQGQLQLWGTVCEWKFVPIKKMEPIAAASCSCLLYGMG
jgi:hypothetical protein